MAKRKIVLMTHDNRFGTDVSAYSSSALAFKSACEIIAEDIAEVDDAETRKRIAMLINAGQYEEAVNEWQSFQDERSLTPETISITATTIDANIRRRRLKVDVG